MPGLHELVISAAWHDMSWHTCRALPNPIYTFDGAEVCLFVKDHKGQQLDCAMEASLGAVVPAQAGGCYVQLQRLTCSTSGCDGLPPPRHSLHWLTACQKT